MKVSEQFKSTIKAYLDNMAAVDSLFAPVYQKPTKNIDNCITYILNQVKKSGCCGFSDDEIFGMALHYYQEDNIEDLSRGEEPLYIHSNSPNHCTDRAIGTAN